LAAGGVTGTPRGGVAARGDGAPDDVPELRGGVAEGAADLLGRTGAGGEG
jgi:hypothetical protein